MTRWPLAWLHPVQSALRGPLGLLGVISLGLLALAALGISVGGTILIQDTSDGWADLAGGIALGLGLMLLLGGLALSVAVHVASRAEGKAPVWLGRILLALAGAEITAFLLWNDGTPLARYVLVLMLGLGAIGAWLLSRSRSRPA